MSELINSIKSVLMTALFYVFRVFPIKHNRIVISSFAGKGYGDNAKAICEVLLKDKREYDLVWLCKNMDEAFPKGIRKVPYYSLKAIYNQVTAQIWIDNRRKPGYVRKRKNQFYICTNHGNLGIKRVEFDAESALSKRYIRAALNDSKMADIFLSGSKFETEYVRRAYRFDGEFLEEGYPRQDKLINPDNREKERIKNSLFVSPNTHILLYAPTFRVEMKHMDLNVYKIEWKRILAAMKQRFGGEWVGISRLHPNISELSQKLIIPEEVIDASDYPDFEELVLISDCLISDYSSTLLEAAIAGKKVFVFATDIEDYKKDRNFIIPFNEMPFDIATDNEQLERAVLQYDEEWSAQRRRDFFENRYYLTTTGHASEHVADRIRKIIEKNED